MSPSGDAHAEMYGPPQQFPSPQFEATLSLRFVASRFVTHSTWKWESSNAGYRWNPGQGFKI